MPEAHGADGWRRISPVALLDFVVVAVRQGFFQALPALAVGVASASSSDRVELAWVLWGAAALLLLGLAWSVLSYLRFGYRVHSTRMEVRKGVLHRQVLDVDFERIQNVSVQEPFYLRPFGQAVVGIDTAGSNDKEIRLPGLTLAEARRLRERLVAEAGEDAKHPAEHEEETLRGTLLLRLERRDVLIAGLTSNFLLWVAVAAGTVFGSGDTAEQAVAWGVERFGLDVLADTLRQRGGNLLLGAVVAGAVLLGLLLLPALSALGALFRYDGYTLTVDGDRFRRASGLLTRHDDSVRQHKIQAVTLRQNAVALLFGRINLKLRQASAGAAADSGIQLGGSKATSFLVPSLTQAQARTLTGRFLPGSDQGEVAMTGVDLRSWIRINVLVLLLPFSAGMAALALAVHGAFLLVWALVATLWSVISYRCWKQTGWGVAGDHVWLRKGFIGSSTTVFPLFKVQRVDLVQTPAQRRRGLAHLTVHLASHSLTVPWMRYEDAERLRDLALYRAVTATEPWF